MTCVQGTRGGNLYCETCGIGGLGHGAGDWEFHVEWAKKHHKSFQTLSERLGESGMQTLNDILARRK